MSNSRITKVWQLLECIIDDAATAAAVVDDDADAAASADDDAAAAFAVYL